MQQASATDSGGVHIRFGHGGAFYGDLRKRADAYFEGAGRPRRDLGRMYLKTAIILTWFFGSWALLVFYATTWWQGVIFAMSIGLAIAGIGMGIQHDANHGGYSNTPWVNRALGLTLDLMGVCSYFWRQKHNIIHHTYTNIQGVDFDLDFGVIARLSPEQPRRGYQRYQHYYMWFLYCFLLPKWVFHDDFVLLRTMKAGPHKLPPMSRGELALFYGAKVVFVAWSLVIPSFFHPIWQVVLFHLLAASTMGVVLSSTFQLAHCAVKADFPPPPPDGEIIAEDWGAHQVSTTIDFARTSRPLAWFLGGLNFQVEHHLFPKVCHLHYPALSRIVEETAAEHGVRYRCETTLKQALAAHYRHLEKMGREDGEGSPTVREVL